MSDFTIYPAIDLKGGQCVRLRQGVADDAKVYSHDPIEQALSWQTQGAKWLHVVDLDGAFCGVPSHLGILQAIIEAVNIPVQIGGGMRTDENVAAAIAAGASRVILGTRALADPDGLAGLLAKYGEKLAVGVDARNGFVQVHGWTETTGMRAADLAVRASRAGVRTIIYTDTATDGMLRGPNFQGVANLCDTIGENCYIIASGGIHSLEDIRKLRALKRPNLTGAIVGKALYEGVVTLSELNASANVPLT